MSAKNKQEKIKGKTRLLSWAPARNSVTKADGGRPPLTRTVWAFGIFFPRFSDSTNNSNSLKLRKLQCIWINDFTKISFKYNTQQTSSYEVLNWIELLFTENRQFLPGVKCRLRLSDMQQIFTSERNLSTSFLITSE